MNSNTGWGLRVRRKVNRKLERLSSVDRLKLMKVIESLPQNPFAGDIDKMEGEENVWRRRVGSYRIFLELLKEERVVYVYKVERRTSSTY